MKDHKRPAPAVVHSATFLLAAACATFLYAGILDPRNVQWMVQEGDLLQHFLGWHFFRQESWSWPLGAIHTYGTELQSSIVFTDALPLLALPLKLVSPWLPEAFQYQGIASWLHIVLNALAASLLLYRLKVNAVSTVLVSLLLACLPAVLFRGPGALGHESLMAHWIILFGMYLLLFYPSASAADRWRWCALLVVATLVHFYLFMMAAMLWGVWWLIHSWHRYRRDGRSLTEWRGWLLYSAAQPLLIFLVMWGVGYLYSSGTGSGGYGLYSAELAAYFNPQANLPGQISFSSLITPWATAIGGQYEGVAYVGVGTMALWACALLTLMLLLRHGYRDAPAVSRYAKGLGMLSVGAFLYALGDPITLGNHAVELPIGWPKPLRELLRASGRFNWLLMYGTTLAALWLLARRFRPGVLTALVAVVWLLQLWDLGSLYQYIHERNLQAGAYRPSADARYEGFYDPHLQRALQRHNSLHVAPANNIVAALPTAWLAGMHGMDINVAYIARMSPEDIARAVAPAEEALSSRQLNPDVVYAMTRDTWQEQVCSMSAVRCQVTPLATFAWLRDTHSSDNNAPPEK